MTPVTLKQTVDAPLAAVWESWDRYADVHSFHPGIENSYLVENSRSTGLGAKRRCDFVGGKNYILEEIVAYEEQRKMTLEQFLHNNRKINEGNDLPPPFLGALYRAIRESEIKAYDAPSTTPPSTPNSRDLQTDRPLRPCGARSVPPAPCAHSRAFRRCP